MRVLCNKMGGERTVVRVRNIIELSTSFPTSVYIYGGKDTHFFAIFGTEERLFFIIFGIEGLFLTTPAHKYIIEGIVTRHGSQDEMARYNMIILLSPDNKLHKAANW